MSLAAWFTKQIERHQEREITIPDFPEFVQRAAEVTEMESRMLVVRENMSEFVKALAGDK